MKESDNAVLKIIKKRKRASKLTPARMIIFGFILLILAGAFLLFLPISSKSGNFTGFANALFTATSSVCVTGLVVVDTNTYWSLFGQIVILALIQIGALGIMSVVTLFSVVTGRALGLNQRLALKESISNYSLENIFNVFKGILKVTLIIEGFGAAIISIVLIPAYGLIAGVGKSIFHSISSFCNAGFDVFGTETESFKSLAGYNGNFLMILTTAMLIIIGGLGFIVWNDLAKTKKLSRLTVHTKIVLVMTGILLITGTLIYFIFESANTMNGMPWYTKLLNAFFHSVSARTAGFATLPIEKMDISSNLSTIILMFIGAAPGSTAGGIKVTTVFVLAATVSSFLRGYNDVQVFKKRIATEIIHKSISVFILGIILVIATTGVLLANNEGSLLEALFETVSAFGTVGLSTGITPNLSDVSKYQLVATMLLGRVGTITAFAVFTSMQGKNNLTYRCPEGKITVG